MKFDSKIYQITQPGSFGNISMGIGVLALILSAVGYLTNAGQFFHSYLVSFAFWVTLGLGGMFFTMLHHLTSSTWSTVFRRISETVTKILPLLFIFFIPIMLGGIHELYHWSHADVIANDELLQKKSGYLNEVFFIIRTVLYFLIWFFFATKLYTLSILQDTSDDASLTQRMLKFSSAGMILFALTISFAAFDWLMSTDAHWYSTIFGVYIFAGSYLAILTFLVLASHFLQGNGILNKEITVEHFHDLGKLLFGFIIFWAYIAGSQYFLIWYANIPEETIWFLHRWEGSWKPMSQFLMFGHFVIPFIILVFRASKRNLSVLKTMAAWILFMHYVDIYWIVMPTFHQHGVHFSWMDLTTFLGIGGIFISLFWRQFSAKPVVPVNDPTLQKSFGFMNV
ncbi:MAG: hypothetical protein H8E64_06185 [Candidatus Marinimicrobia bacterium]|nr:hypothetical protein [Candidatus Neomarinimicrobiota bacterium]